MSNPNSIPEYCRRMNREGLNQGTSGNISVRGKGGFWVTPSGVPYDQLTGDLCAWVDDAGTVSENSNPSSEWRFHHKIYQHTPLAGAVVHVHSPYATALACLRKPIPPFHYMVAVTGGEQVRCSPYETFGTEALANAITDTLGDSRACLIANHGQIAWGRDLDHAFAVATEVEVLARQYLIACSSGESPTLLSSEEMQRNLEKFKTYGSHREA